MLHTVNNELFNKFKERSETLNYDGDIDMRMNEHVKRFNNLKNVTSVWSCSGHTIPELQQYHENGCSEESLSSMFNFSHIIFVINEDENNILNNISSWINEMHINEWMTFRPTVKLLQLVNLFDDERETRYNAVEIQMNTTFNHYNQDTFMANAPWERLLTYLEEKQ